MFELDLVSLKNSSKCITRLYRAVVDPSEQLHFCLTACAQTQPSVWEQNPGSYNLEFIVFFRDPLNLGKLGHVQVKPRPILY